MTDVRKLSLALRLIEEWLVDNTDVVFEEEPRVDDARAYLERRIQEANGTQGDTV